MQGLKSWKDDELAWRSEDQVTPEFLEEISRHHLKHWPDFYYCYDVKCCSCQQRGNVQSCKKLQTHQIKIGEGWTTRRYNGSSVEYACEHCIYLSDGFKHATQPEHLLLRALWRARAAATGSSNEQQSATAASSFVRHTAEITINDDEESQWLWWSESKSLQPCWQQTGNTPHWQKAIPDFNAADTSGQTPLKIEPGSDTSQSNAIMQCYGILQRLDQRISEIDLKISAIDQKISAIETKCSHVFQ